jgi:hypothetical protein
MFELTRFFSAKRLFLSNIISLNRTGLFVLTFGACQILPCCEDALGQTKPSRPIGTLFKIIAGQPRNSKKVGLSFSSVSGVEIYYPTDWSAAEYVSTSCPLKLTRGDVSDQTNIYMEDSDAHSFDLVLSANTETWSQLINLKSVHPGTSRNIGDYKNIPALDATFSYDDSEVRIRRVVYFGYPPMVHALILDCRLSEYERLKVDFDLMLSTISIHDGIH